MKIVAFASALVLGASICGAAEAQTRRVPSYGYVFGEYDYYSGGGSSLNGGGLGAGWRFNRYFAAQIGGQYSRKSGVDFTNGYIEGLVHLLPVNSRVSLYGSIGGAYASQSLNSPLGTVSLSRGGYRAGVGGEYSFAPQWSFRASFHRQNTFSVFDDFGVGLGYRF
ncbi:MAG: outer membrane beta-barrel protein [Pseudomonadota bacterium]